MASAPTLSPETTALLLRWFDAADTVESTLDVPVSSKVFNEVVGTTVRRHSHHGTPSTGLHGMPPFVGTVWVHEDLPRNQLQLTRGLGSNKSITHLILKVARG